MAADSHGPIDEFVSFVRRRVNRHRLWTALVWAVVAGAGMLVVIGLCYVLQGYAVPGGWIAAAAGAAGTAGAAGWLWSRLGVDQSARFVDKFFNLQDAVASYLHFKRAGRTEGYYALQAVHTQRRVEKLSPESVAYQPPRRGLVLACSLAAVALPLSLRGPSDEVLARLEQEKAIEETTAAENKELLKEVEELAKETKDPFEKELLDFDKLRKWVVSLEATKDHKEALRQYAQLERELNQARMAIERKKEEQLLERAAEKLEEGRETQPLAEELQQKKYDKAAEQLAAMTPPKDKSMTEQRKALSRLKAASQRMAAAARASQSAKSGEQAKSGKKSDSKSQQSSAAKGGKGAEGANGSSGEGGGELDQTLEDLAAAVEELDESLEEAEKQEKEFGECDGECKSQCQSCQNAVESELGKLCKSLKKLAVRKNAEKKLCKLCEKCSQCQGGLCNSLCQSPFAKPGGKKAGTGSNTARRDARDELVDNGQTTQLKGLKGVGPSLTTVESADEGSGVSSRQASDRQRQFKKQFESFVEREDVPEQVKQGVKNYFQLIHQMETEPAGAVTTAE